MQRPRLVPARMIQKMLAVRLAHRAGRVLIGEEIEAFVEKWD